ncbi:hypothetical protein [Halalkalibacter flavus]|uniref:hypothetical protein n=1 Tax=Halalkalibacter flavus TaxID=3090668 RepID=UPI002FCC15C6
MIKMVILVIIYTAILVYDVPKLKEWRGRTVFVYTLLMIIALYQSIIFVFDLEWPFLHTVFEAVFGNLANQLVEFLEVP